jgi:cytosine/adenosine deaminase-related metal-dependent hydrolase
LSCGRRWRGGRRIAARDNEDGKEETRHGSHYVSQSAVSVVFVNVRAVLRSPLGESVVRDIVDGRWAEPWGDAESSIGEGMWALPGLVDAHAHLAAAELDYRPGVFGDAVVRARQCLNAGVTLVFDKGWTDDVTIQVIDAVAPEERPELEAAERIIASADGYYPGFALEIDPATIDIVVRAQARAGRGWVKLIGDWPRRGVGPVANFTEDELRAAVAAAASEDARVAIHTMARDVPSQAVAAGVQSIEHGLFLTEDDLAVLGERSGMWVPTLLRNEATLAQLGPDSSGGIMFREGLDRVGALLPQAVEAGVHVLAGTDLIGSPADVAAEAIKLAEYGLSSRQVVSSISVAAFEATGRDPSFRPGTPADAVFFPANPVAELGVLAHPRHVVRLGRLI